MISPSSAHNNFFDGMRDASVIMLSYLPVAFAFGVAAVNYGLSTLEALFLSATIYAGASQFIVIALLYAGSSIWIAAATVIMLDLRHVLYGPALYQWIRSPLQAQKTIIWAWGLTDEVFARALIELSKRQQQWTEAWMLGLSISAWLSWALGTVLGGLLAKQVHLLPQFIQASLDFLLPALFLGFLLAASQKKQSGIVICALLASTLGCVYFNLSIAIILGILVGMCIALLQYDLSHRYAHES